MVRNLRVELPQNENLYSQILDSLENPVLVIDKFGVILHSNKAWLNLLHYLNVVPEQASLGCNYLLIWTKAFCSGNALAVMKSEFSNVLAGQQPFSALEVTIRNKLEKINWYKIHISELKDSDKSLFVVTHQNITSLKLAEESQRIAMAAFETKEATIVLDSSKNILRVNRAFTNLTGYSADEVIGTPPSFFNLRINGLTFYRSIWAAVESDLYWQGELSIQAKMGYLLPISLTMTGIGDGQEGKISHYIGNFHDISSQKEAEQIFLTAQLELETEVSTTKEELERIKKDTEAVNSALTVILKNREADRSDAQMAFSRDVEATVLPLLIRLKGISVRRKQTISLIDMLENNLKQIINSYGRVNNLNSAYQKLTSVETQVASMVRQGLPTKVIAATLSISSETVSIHRKKIRKKLGLDSKAVNLYTYLMSLDELKSISETEFDDSVIFKDR